VRIELDHQIVPARDRVAAAQRLADVLGVPWAAQASAGPFSAVYVSESLTLDFDTHAGPLPVLHYAFRVGDAAFDAIVSRLHALGIAYRSTPHGPVDRQINTLHGGRIVYWSEPDGHVWEALTQSYARQPRGA
jgi:catechol 2,3-dioxygenase-like lactoylglutathione lyase family enzyme